MSQLNIIIAVTDSVTVIQVPDVACSKQGQEVFHGLHYVLYIYFTTLKLYSYVPNCI